MKKLAAFTIIELCIVMLLTAIVTGIAFFTLDIFSSATRRYSRDSGQVADLLVLHRLLEEDIRACQTVKTEENGFVCYGNAPLAVYRFSPQWIVRQKAGITDTFYSHVQPLVCRFQKTELALSGQLAEEISFTLLHKDNTIPFYFYKLYSASALMQHDLLQPDSWQE